jgi:WD40 repeat protein
MSISPASASTDVEPALVIRTTTSIAAMTDRRYIFSQDRKHVQVWDALTGELIADAVGEGGAFEPHAQIAILGTEIWDLRNRRRLIESGLPEKNAVAAGFTPNGLFAVIGAPETQVWNLKSGLLAGKILTKTDKPSFLALSDAGDYIAIGAGPKSDIYEIANGRLARTGALAAVWPFRTKPNKGFSEFVDDRAVDFTVVYEETGRVGGTQRRPLWRIDWETGKVNIFSNFLPRTGLTARARGTNVEMSWSVEGSTRATLVGHDAPVQRIAFSPDRWSIATGDKSGDVRLWDAYSGELRHRYLGGTGEIISLSFSPDAQFLLAASRFEIRIYAVTP